MGRPEVQEHIPTALMTLSRAATRIRHAIGGGPSIRALRGGWPRRPDARPCDESKAPGRGVSEMRNSGTVGSLQLTTTLVARGPAAAVVLDDDQVAAIGEGAKRFPVRATVNGYSWRTTVTPMGGETLLGLNRAVRESAGVQAGDTVEVAIELDTAPRQVEVPEALGSALAGDPAAKAAFEALAFTHRKEYARWVGDAKRQETRERRVTRALEMLRAGKRSADDGTDLPIAVSAQLRTRGPAPRAMRSVVKAVAIGARSRLLWGKAAAWRRMAAPGSWRSRSSGLRVALWVLRTRRRPRRISLTPLMD